MLSSLRQRVVRPLLRNRVYTMRDGLARGLKRRGDPGLLALLGLRRTGEPLTREHNFLQSLSLAGHTVYDVGGYEGILTLFFARAVGPAGRVVTFEPNPRNCEQIADHVRLNGFGNVTVLPLGLGSRQGTATLVFLPTQAATGSLEPELQAELLERAEARRIEVPVDTLDAVIEQRALTPPDLVKIDVEGLEKDVLLGMRRTLAVSKPSLHVEIHGSNENAKLANVRGVVDLLLGVDYSILHVETGQAVSLENAAVAKRGHLFCVSRHGPMRNADS